MKANIKDSARSGYLERPERDRRENGKTREPKIACLKEGKDPDTDRYNGWTCSSGHAEGKVIEELFKKGASPGGTLTLRVRWNDKGDTRDDPCPSCKSAICKTVANCDMKIELCVTDGNTIKKEPAPCKSDGTWKQPQKKAW
jgi:hypothetical protein